MNETLKGKVALITGAGSGIGKAAALKLASEGARVALIERTGSELAETAREVEAKGGVTLSLEADISDGGQMKEALGRIKREWGQLDIVVANAGVNGVWAPLDELKIEEWDETQAINVRGTFLTIRESLSLLKVRGGSIIVTASINGTRMFSNSGATSYAASKAAQVAIAKMLGVELGPFHIRVNVICPGAIETNIRESTTQRNVETVRIPVQFPHGSIPLTGHQQGRAEDVAELIWFLASDHARHISGSEIYIDGAQSLLQG